MGVTFITVAVILSVVFTVLLVDARDRVRAAEAEKLQVGERAFSRFEAQRQRDQLVAISALSENSTLKAPERWFVSAKVTFVPPSPATFVIWRNGLFAK